MVVQCANEACRRDIERDWVFCPYCGQDTRPEDSSRAPIPRHNHRFVTGGDYCIDCGGKYNDQYLEVPELARKLGWGTFAVGATIFVVACLIMLVHRTHGPGYDAIASWYEDGKIYLAASGNNTRASQGPRIVNAMLTVGGILAVAGFATARTKRPHYYHGDYIK